MLTRVLLWLVVAVATAACVGTYSEDVRVHVRSSDDIDTTIVLKGTGQFGESVRAVTQAQIIDPHAAEHAAATTVVDGGAAASALDNYEKSFKQVDPPTNAFVIGIGKATQ